MSDAKVVLVVDDEPLVRRVTSRLLVRMEAVVLEASDGEQALELLSGAQHRLPDLVITDCDMPKMGGIAMVHQMRQHRDLAGIPVIVCSGDDCYASEALALGAPFYHKGADMPSLLMGYVAEAFKRSEGDR
jgi:CheY-like chemotaxis protein